MPIQHTLTGGAELTGIKTGVKFKNGLKGELMNSKMLEVFREDGVPVVKVENITNRPDAHYRDIEPLEATEEFFLYPLSEESFNKLRSVQRLQQEK